MSRERTGDQPESVAIIGMAGRFPGARDTAELWQNLRAGTESITFFSDDELFESGIGRATLNDPNYVKAAGHLDGAESFDGQFFDLSPRECEIMDPQHRIFLECAWEALESAGYRPDSCPGPVGVFAGVGLNTYLLNNIQSNPGLMESLGAYEVMLGNDKDFVPTRVCYKLNLKGPGITVQTACSSSLVAIHLACQSLLGGECEMTLAGGVSAMMPQKTGYLYREGMILSPDGHCRAFDSRARGTVRGNGVGIVVLKRLDDALRDGDSICAIIKGSAINNDGCLKAGYTAPSVDGQARVISEALAMAAIDPETISYVEAHGTATQLGDPIEIAALTQAFRGFTNAKQFCAIGSVKTNIGHLDAAAGVAGLIKSALALMHREIPPSLHFEEPNPNIDLASSPFFVNKTLARWESPTSPRRAAVSSFGIGGTNAHIILEEAPEAARTDESRPWQLILISARTDAALKEGTASLREYLKRHSDADLADVAYTTKVGRKAFELRQFLVSRDVPSAIAELESPDPSRAYSYIRGVSPKLVLMFSGQGSQYVGMTGELYRFERGFRDIVDYCSEVLKPQLGIDLRDAMYRGDDAEALNQTSTTQPALFVTEYALATLLMKWGLRPWAMIGHSIGEYVAACLAGVFSLEDGLKLVAARARLMQGLDAGAMLAVWLSEDETRPLLGDELSLAAVNGPSLCVVSGRFEAIGELETKLSQKGISSRRLRTSHAFHSHLMDSILGAFVKEFRGITLNPPGLPYISNVTGTWVTGSQCTSADYWAAHLRRTVRFAEGVSELLKESNGVFLETGPGRSLADQGRQHPDRKDGHLFVSSIRQQLAGEPDVAFLLTALGRIWQAGIEFEWERFYDGERRRRLPLPTYPFQRRRYYIEPRQDYLKGNLRAPATAKKPDTADWIYMPSWRRIAEPGSMKREVSQTSRPWLLFADDLGIAACIRDELERRGVEVICVTPGARFLRTDPRACTINPRNADDYEALIKEIAGRGSFPSHIVHLWSLASANEARFEPEAFDSAQDLGYYSLIFLARAISRRGLADPIRIDVVSSNIYEVTGAESVCPEKATILGPCLVIPQEHVNVECRVIDVAIDKEKQSDRQLLKDLVMAEVMRKGESAVVALRGRHRWAQSFELSRVAEHQEETAALRENGAYLIIGGLGEMGFTFAKYLATKVRARLVLTGRSQLPDRGDWKDWLAARDESDASSRKIMMIKELEELGSEVLYLSADAASKEQMRRVFERAEERVQSINGIIHAAGLVGLERAAWIVDTGRKESEDHFHSKARSLYVLEEMTRGKDFDFCLLTSSLSSVLGGLGFAAYSGANAFMDAFAHSIGEQNSRRWTSVNWDAWRFDSGDHAPAGTLAALAITPREGAEVVDRLLSVVGLPPQIVVSTADLQSRLGRYVNREKDQTNSAEAELPSYHPRPDQQTDYVAPGSELEAAVSEIWKSVLGIDEIGIHDNFFDVGGSSLVATQVTFRIREKLAVELTLQDFFANPTIKYLADKVEEIILARSNPEKLDGLLALLESTGEDEAVRLLTLNEDSR